MTDQQQGPVRAPDVVTNQERQQEVHRVQGAQLPFFTPFSDAPSQWGVARELDSTVSRLAERNVNAELYAGGDGTFEPSKEEFAELTAGIPKEYHGDLIDVDDMDQALRKRARLEEELAMERQLADNGWSGTAARLLVGMLDETAIGLSVATEGAAAPFIWGSKLSRAKRALTVAALAGGETALLESYAQQGRVTEDWKDVALAVAMTGAMAGGIDATMSKYFRSEVRRIEESTDDSAVAAAVPQASRPQAAVRMDAEIADIEARLAQAQEQAQRAATGGLFDSARRVEEMADQAAAPDALLRQLDELKTREEQARGRQAAVEENDSFISVLPREARSAAAKARRKGQFRDDPVGFLTDFISSSRKRTPGTKDAQKIRGQAEASVREASIDLAYRTAQSGKRVARRSTDQQIEDLRTARKDSQAAEEDLRKFRETFGLDDAKELELRAGQDADELLAGRIRARATILREAAERDQLMPLRQEVRKLKAELQAARLSRQALERIIAQDSAGAARVGGSYVARDTVYEGSAEIPAADQAGSDSAYLEGRFSAFAVAMKSASPAMRALGRALLSDGVGLEKRAKRSTDISAAEIKDREYDRLGARFSYAFDTAFKSWAKRHGRKRFSIFGGEAVRREFAERVTLAARGGADSDPDVQRVAKEWSRNAAEVLDMMHRAGVAGFEDVAHNNHYVARVWNSNSFRRLSEEGRGEDLKRLLQSAIRAADDAAEPSDAVVRAYSDAIYNRFLRDGYEIDPTFNHRLFSGELEAVTRALRDSGVDEDTIQSARDALKKRQEGSKAGVPGNAKFRIRLDEQHSIMSRGERLSISDLLVNDIELLNQRYLHTNLGHYAVAMRFRQMEMVPDDELIRVDSIYEDLMNQAKTTGTVAGSREAQSMQIAYNLIMGRPPTDNFNGGAAEAMRIIRDFNFVRLMGQVGFAQVAEFGNIIGQLGPGVIFRAMLNFNKLMFRDAEGRLKEPLLRDMEDSLFATGADRIMNRPHLREEDYGLDANDRLHQAVRATRQVLERGKRVIGDVSMMNGLTQLLHRVTASGIGQRIIKAAAAGDKAAFMKDIDRWRSVGLDEADIDAIIAQVQKHSKEVPNESGRMTRVFNAEAWDDLEARDKLGGAIHKMAYRIIQKQNVGELPAFAHTPLGGLVVQFRTFMLGSWEKQTLHGVNQRDLQTFWSWNTSMMLAGASYWTQQQLNAAGLREREEILEERLSPENLMKSAFQRSGFASLLPATVDTAAGIMPWVDEPIFKYGRTTGLATGFIGGIPAVDLIDSSYSAATALTRAPRQDYTMSQSDYRAVFGLLPNVVGMRNINKRLQEDAPYLAVEDPRALSDLFD